MKVPNGAVFGPVVNAAMLALEHHVFETLDRCRCGYESQTSEDWDEHVMAAVIDSVGVWLESCTSDTLGGDPFVRAADWAAQQLRAGSILAVEPAG